MNATRDGRRSWVNHSRVPTWDLMLRGIAAPLWIVLLAAGVAGGALLGVDHLIRSDAHVLLGFFVIAAGVTWTGHTCVAATLTATLVALRTVLAATGPTARAPSLILLSLVSSAVLLTLGIVLTRTFRRLVLHMDEVARRDPLTGLLNTRAFQEIAERERTRVARTGEPISIAFLDLDRFKAINDTHGHLVGDAVLKAFGETITDAVRTTDVVGRVGGDEFTLLLPNTDQFETSAILQRIRYRIAMRTDIPLVTATVGYVTFPSPPESVEEMVQMADDLMYKAKRRDRSSGALVGKVVDGAVDGLVIDITCQPGDAPQSISITSTSEGVSGQGVPPDAGMAQARRSAM